MIGGYFLINHIKMKNEILESLRPWDCQIFEKDPCSPFICFGGSAPAPVKKLQKRVTQEYHGGLRATEGNIEGGKESFDRAARDYGGGGWERNLNRGLSTSVKGAVDFVGGFGEHVKKGVRSILGIPQGGGGDSGPQTASANYSSTASRKKGKQKGQKDAILGKSKERVATRESLKVRRTA